MNRHPPPTPPAKKQVRPLRRSTPAIKNRKPIKIANCFWPKNGLLSQSASSLNDAIRSTAEDAGVLDDYTSAVNEYRQAMNLNAAWQAVKEQGVRILKYAIPGAGHCLRHQVRSQQIGARSNPMSHKPLSMKTLHRISQQPMVRAEDPVKASTLDARHQRELERRSTIQRTSNVKTPAGKK